MDGAQEAGAKEKVINKAVRFVSKMMDFALKVMEFDQK